MNFLDFETPIADIYQQLKQVKEIGKKGKVNVDGTVEELEQKLAEARKEIYCHLTPWQRIQLSRHPDRPYTLFYLENICDKFIELHGDRLVKDDKAIIGGFGSIEGQSIMFIGHQKGVNTKMRQFRNFGMANPEGYRKAMRLMKLAEKFNKPIVTLIDTPGAYPGLEAEERGQAEAIARNLYEMTLLKVPVICIVIGEGASGGAMGISIGDKIFMLENTWYSVISPESCSSILWRSWDYKKQAAQELKPTSQDMLNFGLIDGIIKEPLGGAHAFPDEMVHRLKKHILENIAILNPIDPEERIEQRINKFSKMGVFDERAINS